MVAAAADLLCIEKQTNQVQSNNRIVVVDHIQSKSQWRCVFAVAAAEIYVIAHNDNAQLPLVYHRHNAPNNREDVLMIPMPCQTWLGSLCSTFIVTSGVLSRPSQFHRQQHLESTLISPFITQGAQCARDIFNVSLLLGKAQ